MTKIYGSVHDYINAEGELDGGITPSERADGAFLVFSDGTVLHMANAVPGFDRWRIVAISEGVCFQKVVPDGYRSDDLLSDVAHFSEGLKWAFLVRSAKLLRRDKSEMKEVDFGSDRDW